MSDHETTQSRTPALDLETASMRIWADSPYRTDALDWLRKVCEARTILEKAGSHDLAEWVWGNLCPEGVPIRVRHDALTMAGYPFRTQIGAGRTAEVRCPAKETAT